MQMAVHACGVGLCNGRKLHNAGIVDENVHASEFLFGLVEQKPCLIRIAHIRFDAESLCPGTGERISQFPCSLFAAGIIDDNSETVLGQPPGNGRAYAARRSRDDDCLVHDDLLGVVALVKIMVTESEKANAWAEKISEWQYGSADTGGGPPCDGPPEGLSAFVVVEAAAYFTAELLRLLPGLGLVFCAAIGCGHGLDVATEQPGERTHGAGFDKNRSSRI